MITFTAIVSSKSSSNLHLKIFFAADQLQAFHQVVSQMLQDVQERLVFRSNIYIRDEIRGYLPSSGDLAYPEKLEMMEVRSLIFTKIVLKDRF